MFKEALRYLLFVTFLTGFATTRLFAQASIIIGAVNPGPYSQGSTITVPFRINDATGCIEKTNVFTIEMSDELGSFASPTVVATSSANTFYATYLNATIPNSALPGAFYKFRVKASSSSGITSNASNDVTIVPTGSIPDPGTSTFPIIATGVFGQCSGPSQSPYIFTNTSTNYNSVFVSFFDESTGLIVGTPHDITTTDYSFIAGAKNYRVTVTATNQLGTVSTRSYQLINNQINTSLASSGNNIACIDPATGRAVFSFTVDYTTPAGIQNNYPGNIYTITWGDNVTTTYTLCEIIAAGGVVSHPYTSVSCGRVGTSTNLNNRFAVNFMAGNSHCGPIGSPSTGYVTILQKPVNQIGYPTLANSGNACAGNVQLVNLSIPGPAAASTNTSCFENPNARYAWLIDGNPVPGFTNVPRSTNFNHIFARGNYVITLRDISGNSQCFADDILFNLCVQDPPVPSFSLPIVPVCQSGPVIPTNTSTVDNLCSVSTYTWSVFQSNGTTPASGVTYAGNTSAISETPQFLFATPGIYRIRLTVSSASCGAIASALQDVTVEAPPKAQLQADLSVCGTQTLSFTNSMTSSTRVELTGTPTTGPTTYTWTVTGGNFSFVGGTNNNSQYPQIEFTDFATYTVNVSHTNNCSTVSDSQNITFQEAPTIVAASPQIAICEGNTIKLTSTVTGPAPVSYQWRQRGSGASGTFSTGTAQNTTYNPSAADIAAGTVTLYLEATTGLVGPCSSVNSNDIIVTITPTTVITSAASKSICSNDNINYLITSNNTGATYTWTATLTAGSVTGFSASGTNSSITDILVNNAPNIDGTVTYVITPTTNGCTGTPFNFAVTILAVPIVTSTAANAAICSGSQSGISMSSNLAGTRYRWTVNAPAGITGATAQATLTSSSVINQTLINNTTGVLRVTYTITPYNTTGCEGAPVDVFVDVSRPQPPANAGPNQILCNQTTATLTANDPGTFVGTWTQTSGPATIINNPNNYQTTVTGLTGANTYAFTWTITALAPCIDTYSSVTITNNPDVVASFTSTAKAGCGDLTVRFTNTSNNQPGANFIWNFGDGQTSSLASPQHTFAQRTDGRDTTYYISLGVIGNCLQRPDLIDSVIVRPATPIARILPASTNGCGNFALEVRNTSPGNNTSYDFYLYDGSTLVQRITRTDKANVIFNPISTTARKVFTLYMVAIGHCNNTNETTRIPIAISPSTVVAQMVIQDGVNSGCAPLSTTFINNSFGGDNFYYTIYDANNNVVDRPIGGSIALPYIFGRAGTYYVTITAISSCGMDESTRTRVDVYATPTPAFVADITTACKDALITFTNTTTSNEPNMPVTSLLYDWDFGDGSPHSALFAPTHGYHFTGRPYTVTLKVTNPSTGCTDILVRTSYIVMYGPPKTAFSIRPDSVTSIPNYTFSFIDQTPADAVTWKWTFGDGQTSTRRNPTVTYPDTGVYKVTLTTATATGCDSTITRTVRITGVPGQLFLPNAFMPESATTELRMFMAKGSGIKTWHLQIFNNYGQLVWQTTKLSARGEPEEGWDGTFKGVPSPQGVYQWQASATFINGTEWKGNSYRDELPKRVGSVHLIR